MHFFFLQLCTLRTLAQGEVQHVAIVSSLLTTSLVHGEDGRIPQKAQKVTMASAETILRRDEAKDAIARIETLEKEYARERKNQKDISKVCCRRREEQKLKARSKSPPSRLKKKDALFLTGFTYLLCSQFLIIAGLRGLNGNAKRSSSSAAESFLVTEGTAHSTMPCYFQLVVVAVQQLSRAVIVVQFSSVLSRFGGKSAGVRQTMQGSKRFESFDEALVSRLRPLSFSSNGPRPGLRGLAGLGKPRSREPEELVVAIFRPAGFVRTPKLDSIQSRSCMAMDKATPSGLCCSSCCISCLRTCRRFLAQTVCRTPFLPAWRAEAPSSGEKMAGSGCGEGNGSGDSLGDRHIRVKHSSTFGLPADGPLAGDELGLVVVLPFDHQYFWSIRAAVGKEGALGRRLERWWVLRSCHGGRRGTIEVQELKKSQLITVQLVCKHKLSVAGRCLEHRHLTCHMRRAAMICSLSLPLPKIDFSVAAVSSAFFPHCLSADPLSSTMIHANLFSPATGICPA
ncbi:hypothetical protein KCU74_g7, partial [Aureobasidium melanogenum]